MENKTGKIYQAIPAIMGALGPIGRNQKNQQQGFKYRGIDDLYNAVQQVMAEHKVFSVPQIISTDRQERTSKSGSVLIHVILTIRYVFYAEDGSSVECVVVGEGMDSGDKAANKAMSIADKYALTQIFKIRTEDTADPDSEVHEIKQPVKNPNQPGKDFVPYMGKITDYVIPFGKHHKGKKITEVPLNDLVGFASWLENQAAKEKKPLEHKAKEFVDIVAALALESQHNNAPQDDGVPF